MQSNRPSKQFILRGSIAIGLTVILLVVQTNWFRALFHKKPLPARPKTVGSTLAQDTNGNGIADWEEKLWGLDPTVLYTNGVPNKTIIEQKKSVLGIQTTSADTDTEKLARDLFALSAAFGQSDETDTATLAQIAANFGSTIDLKQVGLKYSLNDVQSIATTTTSLQTYATTFGKLTKKYNFEQADIDVVINALQNDDYSRLPELAKTATDYKAYAAALIKIPAPIGVSKYHLDIANSLYGMAASFTYLMQLENDSTQALAGIAIYNNYSERLGNSILGMQEYFMRYGILR